VPDFFQQLINSGNVGGDNLTVWGVVAYTLCSLILGLGVAAVYMYKNKYSQTMAVALVILPPIVQIIIMLVGGNVGAGVAVAGAFNLVRFRSMPGNARAIGALFFAMALGFVIGMEQVLFAFVFFIAIGGVSLLLTIVKFGEGQSNTRILRITIPENLDYEGLFDEIFARYTQSAVLERVRTTNMGSLFELTYLVQVRSETVPKSFIDELRCCNGNLNILYSREKPNDEDL